MKNKTIIFCFSILLFVSLIQEVKPHFVFDWFVEQKSEGETSKLKESIVNKSNNIFGWYIEYERISCQYCRQDLLMFNFLGESAKITSVEFPLESFNHSPPLKV